MRVKTNGVLFWDSILVYFSGDWDVHWGYGIWTHGQIARNSIADSACPAGRPASRRCLHPKRPAKRVPIGHGAFLMSRFRKRAHEPRAAPCNPGSRASNPRTVFAVPRAPPIQHEYTLGGPSPCKLVHDTTTAGPIVSPWQVACAPFCAAFLCAVKVGERPSPPGLHRTCCCSVSPPPPPPFPRFPGVFGRFGRSLGSKSTRAAFFPRLGRIPLGPSLPIHRTRFGSPDGRHLPGRPGQGEAGSIPLTPEASGLPFTWAYLVRFWNSCIIGSALSPVGDGFVNLNWLFSEFSLYANFRCILGL